MAQNRREFLKFFGSQAIIVGGLRSTLPLLSTKALAEFKRPPFSMDPTAKDDVVLGRGLYYKSIIQYEDRISSNDFFGYNNDFLAVLPGKDKNEALLWVNHESVSELFVSGEKGPNKSKNGIDKERYAVGGSLVKIKKGNNNLWKLDPQAAENFRVTGNTKIPFNQNTKILGKTFSDGMVGNCGGGITPYGTILTCEENYDNFYGERLFNSTYKSASEYGWEKYYNNPPEHYGWVVEIDPVQKTTKKLIALGRFAHESATVTTANDGRLVVYSGDDKKNEFIYKFISNSKSNLDEGELFVANTKQGKWISLDRNKQPILQKEFKNQIEVLTHARYAAKLVGATAQDRPEDIEIHPYSKDVYICLTNNSKKGNMHGQIAKISERDSDPAAKTFHFSILAVGGKKWGFSCPDNIAFDKKGHLWMCSDISGKRMNKPPYTKFKNNGLFYIPLYGPLAGQAYQVASAPIEAEFTGVTFSPDFQTIFVSVQHPGERTKSLSKLTSHWPGGIGTIPRPGVIQIFGPSLSKLMSNKPKKF